MIKIRPTGAENVVELELSNGTVFRACEFYEGELTVAIPANPGFASSGKVPMRDATHLEILEEIRLKKAE